MKPIILTHGGVGSYNKYSDGCETACRAGAAFLKEAGHDTALRAVIEAAAILEDDPRFNAGTGANLRIDGSLQQDAIVATSDGRIGAVACLDSTKNPVRVARLVMDSPHIMLCGEGATRFARERGFPSHDCTTEDRRTYWKAALERLKTGKLKPYEEKWRGRGMSGTIGSVARASDGTFAVSCSTGGTSLMLRGRIGDTPIFGSGVMVGPAGAICATGDGEEIVRRIVGTRAYQRIEMGEHPQHIADSLIEAFPQPYMIGLLIVSTLGHGIAMTGKEMASCALEC